MLPEVIFDIVDGSLGILPEQTDKLQLTFGAATSGPTGAVLAINSKNALTTTFTGGPLVEACALKLEIGGGPVYALRVPAGTAGEISPVAGPTGSPAITVTGAPVDSCDVRIQITAQGTTGVSKFTYSRYQAVANVTG